LWLLMWVAIDECFYLLKDEVFVHFMRTFLLLDDVDDLVEFGQLLFLLVDFLAVWVHHF
jgi:hypothetical protein